MTSDKPTLALARRLAREKGYEDVEIEQASDGMLYAALILENVCEAEVYAPTRTAAIAGLIAVIRALPVRRGKR